MARLPGVGADNNQWGALLNEFLRVAHRDDGMLRGMSRMLDVRDFGVVGDGVADDSLPLNMCLANASDNGKTVFIPAGMNIRVTRNLFIYGNASIVGENKYQSKIILDGDLESLGVGMSAYWVNFGIASKGGAVASWTGSVSQVQFYITAIGSGTGSALHAIQFHKAEDFTFENCIIDLRPVGHANRAAMVSQIDGNWCSSAGTAHGRIVNNMIFGESNGGQELGGSGGVNLVGLNCGLVAGNRIEGFSDDAIAMISCNHCVVRDNWIKGIRSRVAAFSGNDITFIANYLERQPGADHIWATNTDFYATFPAGKYSPAPENIKFIGNTAVLPTGAPPAGYHNFLDLGGVRNCVASGNIFVNDSNLSNKPRIFVWVFTAIPDWQDPTFKDPIGQARPYRVTLTNNVMTGQYPGQIEEVPGDLVGPIIYQGNLASGFVMFGSNSFLEDSNKVV